MSSWGNDEVLNLSLRRPFQLVGLEQKLQSDVGIGPCTNNNPIISTLQPSACQELYCLWSASKQENVDLLINPLSPLPGGLAKHCPDPQGGQRALPLQAHPRISFVITMHAGSDIDKSAQCILEIFRTAHEVESAEYIIVSTVPLRGLGLLERSLRLLQKNFHTRIVFEQVPANATFGAARNKGIDLSSGEYVALLNNDVFVSKGWLSMLLWTLESDDSIGIVGPLFLDQEKLVEDAGGILFTDGSKVRVGHGKPLPTTLSYARTVDYLSPACMIFRRQLFLSIKGFDGPFENGYYAETDLAFKVTSAGLKVVFQPLAVVFFKEGSNSWTTATTEKKKIYSAESKKLLLDKWRDMLQHHCPKGTSIKIASQQRQGARLLWVNRFEPTGNIMMENRVFSILKAINNMGHTVSVHALTKAHNDALLRSSGVHVLPVSTKLRNHLQLKKGECAYDIIIISGGRSFNTAFKTVRKMCKGVPIIYDAYNLYSQGDAGNLIPQLNAAEINISVTDSEDGRAAFSKQKLLFELPYIEQSNMTMVASSYDMALLKLYNSTAKVVVLPTRDNEMYHQESNYSLVNDCSTRSGILVAGCSEHSSDALGLFSELASSELINAKLRVFVVGDRPAWYKQMATANNWTHYPSLSNDELTLLLSQVKVVVMPTTPCYSKELESAIEHGVPIITIWGSDRGDFQINITDERYKCQTITTNSSFLGKLTEIYTDCNSWEAAAAKLHMLLAEQYATGGKSSLKHEIDGLRSAPNLIQKYCGSMP